MHVQALPKKMCRSALTLHSYLLFTNKSGIFSIIPEKLIEPLKKSQKENKMWYKLFIPVSEVLCDMSEPLCILLGKLSFIKIARYKVQIDNIQDVWGNNMKLHNFYCYISHLMRSTILYSS